MKRALLSLLTGLCVMLALSGCSSTDPVQGMARTGSPEDRCSLLLRDIRLYCKDGLRDRDSSKGLECMSRRLELNKVCNK